MCIQSSLVARLTRERDMLLRSWDEARPAWNYGGARRTRARELGRKAENLYIKEPRDEVERPMKRSHHDK
jgi:hypothetical protein